LKEWDDGEMTLSRITVAALAALALVAAIPAPASAQSRASVILTSHRFSPSPLNLSAGKPVRLTLSNQSANAHDFTAPEFFYWSSARGKIPGGVIRLESGESRTITLTPRRGSYKLKCSRFGHAFLGMSTMIIVR
jgi:uncharacterized cupredoxin-like copper-binding protein